MENTSDKDFIGSKASNLKKLETEGFNIPNFFVLTDEMIQKILRNDSEQIKFLFKQIDENKKYAVRSSGINEDLSNLSFAGMYESYLNVSGKENIIKAIKDCYDSKNSERNIEYAQSNNIDISNSKIAIIVQEMVEADVSLIAFSVNVVNGNDTEFIFEVVSGLGDKNASGLVNPEKYIFDWYVEEIKQKDGNLLNENLIKEIAATVLKIQKFYGYPVDIEMSIKDEKIWILQARPITKILYSNIEKQWTTANFKDGGVSATVCYPLLWSIYSYMYEYVAKTFFAEAEVFTQDEITDQVKYVFSRTYWNVSACKEALARLPGFVERDYDNELGVDKYYEGQGIVSKLSLKDWIRCFKVIKNYLRMVEEQKSILVGFRDDKLVEFKEYYNKNLDNVDLNEMQNLWKKLITEDHFIAEKTYLWQAFINIVKQTLFKKKMLKYFEYNEYLNLLSGVKNLAHTKHIKRQIEILNLIREDEEKYLYWTQNISSKIYEDYINGITDNALDLLKEYIEEYGYHSDRELDLTYKCYYEDIENVIAKFKKNLENNDYMNEIDFENEQYQKFEEQLSKVKSKSLKKSVYDMREFIWWREEIKDISIRYYSLVKKYTKKFAEVLVSNKILNEEKDIYYLTKKDIFEFIEGKKTKEDLYKIIEKNKSYYNSFRNFDNPTNIGQMYVDIVNEKVESIGIIKGIGCSDKIVEGKVRVVENAENIAQIEHGDILVTKFVDTGWTSKFPILKGVISEAGGTLCHTSVVAREYGLSTIVGVKDVCSKLKTGNIIQMNGITGEIKILS